MSYWHESTDELQRKQKIFLKEVNFIRTRKQMEETAREANGALITGKEGMKRPGSVKGKEEMKKSWSILMIVLYDRRQM